MDKKSHFLTNNYNAKVKNNKPYDIVLLFNDDSKQEYENAKNLLEELNSTQKRKIRFLIIGDGQETLPSDKKSLKELIKGLTQGKTDPKTVFMISSHGGSSKINDNDWKNNHEKESEFTKIKQKKYTQLFLSELSAETLANAIEETARNNKAKNRHNAIDNNDNSPDDTLLITLSCHSGATLRDLPEKMPEGIFLNAAPALYPVLKSDDQEKLLNIIRLISYFKNLKLETKDKNLINTYSINLLITIIQICYSVETISCGNYRLGEMKFSWQNQIKPGMTYDNMEEFLSKKLREALYYMQAIGKEEELNFILKILGINKIEELNFKTVLNFYDKNISNIQSKADNTDEEKENIDERKKQHLKHLKEKLLILKINRSDYLKKKDKNLQEIKDLLNNSPAGEEIDLPNCELENNNCTALHLAIKINNIDVIKEILKYAEDNRIIKEVLTAKDNIGFTPLHYAIKTKNIVIIEEILKYAKDSQIIEKVLTARNHKEATPFYLAIKECNIDAVERIIEHIEKKPELLKKVLTTKVQGFTTFHYAIQKKEIKVINKILESAESCGVLEKVLTEKTLKITPLHYAMRIESLEAIKQIIEYSSRAKNDDERKADPQYDFLKKVLTEKDNNGKSFTQYLWESSLTEEQKMEIVSHIIQYACRDDNLESIKMILQDLTVNKPDFLGKMDDFFILAVKSKSQKGAELILRKAKELDIMQKVLTARNRKKVTALHYAIKTKDIVIIEEILKYAKDSQIIEKVLTARNLQEATPFYLAIKECSIDAVEKIIEYIEKKPELLKKVLTTKVQGFTTFHYAIQKKEIKVINKILESAESCGVLEKVLKEETRGITPLHYAMRIESLEAIKQIIEYSSRAKNDDERKADPQYDFLTKSFN